VTQRSWQDPLATRPEVLSFRTGPEPSLVRQFLPARRDAFSRKLPSPQGGEVFISSFPARGRALPGARQRLVGLPVVSRASRGSYRMRRSWTPSRRWLGAKGCRHGRASEDAVRGALTTSSRSSVAGAALVFTMPLVYPAMLCSQLVLSHLLWGVSATALAICSPDSGCLRLLPASGLADGSSPLGSGDQPSGRASVRPPLCESLSFAFVERAKRQMLGPPSPEHRQLPPNPAPPILVLPRRSSISLSLSIHIDVRHFELAWVDGD
jgi:hypothetical protein